MALPGHLLYFLKLIQHHYFQDVWNALSAVGVWQIAKTSLDVAGIPLIVMIAWCYSFYHDEFSQNPGKVVDFADVIVGRPSDAEAYNTVSNPDRVGVDSE